MQPGSQRPKQFWTKRRARWASFLVIGALLLAALIIVAPGRPAYIQSVVRCNLVADQICFDVIIHFNRAVGNDTMHLLAVAMQHGAEYWNTDYINGFRPPESLRAFEVLIPVNATAATGSYSFRFSLVVSGAQVDSRTVGWQGG